MWLAVSQSPRPETEPGLVAVKVPSLNHWAARALPKNVEYVFIMMEQASKME